MYQFRPIRGGVEVTTHTDINIQTHTDLEIMTNADCLYAYNVIESSTTLSFR